MTLYVEHSNLRFLSTLSLRRATTPRTSVSGSGCISIHALLAESDDRRRPVLADTQHFYPRSPCGERLTGKTQPCAANLISIHALLAESDETLWAWLKRNGISIHALLAESDMGGWRSSGIGSIFLSTLSLRRATPS